MSGPREWLAADYRRGGSVGLSRQLDNVQSAVRECKRVNPAGAAAGAAFAAVTAAAAAAANTSAAAATADAAAADNVPRLRVSKPRLLSMLTHFRRVEAALLGCRGGQEAGAYTRPRFSST